METGYSYTLTITGKDGRGRLVAGEPAGASVLLDPVENRPEPAAGEQVEVFVYRTEDGTLLGTLEEPMLRQGQLAVLTVTGTQSVGAFLFWGPDKDLLLPEKEQKAALKKGDRVLVALSRNRKGDLIATARIYDLLETAPDVVVNDLVTGWVYDVHPDLGALVAVDFRYHGLIPRKDTVELPPVGTEVEARISRVRQDGKLELSLRKQAHEELDSDGRKILEELERSGGLLALGDKSDPEEIRRVLGMSKAAFKRAVGRLWKRGQVIPGDREIRRK